MTRIGVCDDNAEISAKIAGIINEAFSTHGISFETEAFTDGSSLLKRHMISPFDTLFLDIDMPETGGFDIAKILRDGFSDCLIVFVTSHSELVYDSLDFQPFNFIRKNSDMPLEESIPKIVSKLVANLRQGDTLLIKYRLSNKIPVRIRDIICIESSAHYLNYRIAEKGTVRQVVSRGSISEWQEFFESYNFARVHKGFIVNLSHIRYLNYGRHEVVLSEGTAVPIGKKYKSDLEEKYSLFLRRKL